MGGIADAAGAPPRPVFIYTSAVPFLRPLPQDDGYSWDALGQLKESEERNQDLMTALDNKERELVALRRAEIRESRGTIALPGGV